MVLQQALADLNTAYRTFDRAHPGRAVIGATRSDGVVDAYHRVFGCLGLYVVDGAAAPANRGVNPSLTIVALAERAMAHWPVKGEPDRRPPAS